MVMWKGEPAYSLAMECPDEEVGDVIEEGAWFGLLDGFSDEEVKKYPELEPYRTGGAIVKVDDLGFYYVTYYTDKSEPRATWAEVVKLFG